MQWPMGQVILLHQLRDAAVYIMGSLITNYLAGAIFLIKISLMWELI